MGRSVGLDAREERLRLLFGVQGRVAQVDIHIGRHISTRFLF
jgi:hypothetical protein